MIAQLDDDAFKVREQASATLGELGAAAAPALRAARAKATSAEMSSRIDALLEHMKGGATESGEERRLRRLVEVLELIGTKAARAELAEIGGRTGSVAAWEAKGAIQRLEGKAEIPTTLDLPPKSGETVPDRAVPTPIMPLPARGAAIE